jgi:WD40 repeat protein
MVDALELEGVIGFSGDIKHSLILHPAEKHIIYPLGSTVVVRNVEDSSDQMFLQGHTDRVTCIAMTRDGSVMASGQITHMGYLAEIILWDLTGLESGEQPKLVHRLRLHKVMVQALDFSYNGKYLASIGGVDDNNIVVWNVADGKAICGSPAAHDTALTVKWFNLTDCTLVTGGIGALRMWDLNIENRKVRPMEINTMKERRTFTCLAVSDDDSTILAGSNTGDLVQVSTATKLVLSTGPKPRRFNMGISSIINAGNGELLVGAGDGELATLCAKTFTRKCSQKLLGGVSSIALDTTGEFLFVGTEQCNIYLVQYKELVAELKATCHSEHINDAAYPAGYSELFATCAGSDIRIWHAQTMSELLRVQVPNQECNCLAFMPSGNAIVSGWNDGKIRSFLPQSGGLQYVINEAHRLTGVGNSSGGVVPKNGVTSICPSNDCKRLLSGGADGQVRVWAISKNTQVMIASMKEHKGPVYAISIKKDDSECVSASADGSCITWSLTDQHPFVRIDALFAANFFKSVVYHPDESQLLTCGTDRKITYWDGVNMNAIRIIDGSDAADVNSLHINSDGKFFVSAGADKKVVLWNYDEGSKYFEGSGHSGSISMVKISPDEKRIISVGTEGGIFIWKVPAPFAP